MDQPVDSVTAECPGCGMPLTIPIFTTIADRSDDGVVEVDVLPDAAEIELQALVCAGS